MMLYLKKSELLLIIIMTMRRRKKGKGREEEEEEKEKEGEEMEEENHQLQEGTESIKLLMQEQVWHHWQQEGQPAVHKERNGTRRSWERRQGCSSRACS